MTSHLSLFRFAVNVKGLHRVCTPTSLLEGRGGRCTSNQILKERGSLAEPRLFLFRFAVNVKSSHIVCAPLSVWGGSRGGGLNFQPNFQKEGGGLAGPQLLEGVAGKEEMTFFGGGGGEGGGAMQFSHTEKIKS